VVAASGSGTGPDAVTGSGAVTSLSTVTGSDAVTGPDAAGAEALEPVGDGPLEAVGAAAVPGPAKDSPGPVKSAAGPVKGSPEAPDGSSVEPAGAGAAESGPAARTVHRTVSVPAGREPSEPENGADPTRISGGEHAGRSRMS
jgi:hypothetical protein